MRIRRGWRKRCPYVIPLGVGGILRCGYLLCEHIFTLNKYVFKISLCSLQPCFPTKTM
jgi:hypothetical protein